MGSCQYLGGHALAADRVDVPLVNQRRLRGTQSPPVLSRPLSGPFALLLLPAQRAHHRTHEHDHHERNSGVSGQGQNVHRTLTLPGSPPHLRRFMPALPPSPRRITPSDHRSTRGVNVSGALRRRAAAVLACATALALVACGAPLPDSVVAGSSTTVGWTHTLTSTNPATSAGTEPGNQDLAVMTRGQFARTVEGVTELDESFGTATITDPETFTVRYDLAETDWSDGIPLDTADLMLAWAAGTGILAQERSDDAAVEGDGKEGAGKEEPAEQKGE